MMPNILFYSKDTGDWYVGSEAAEARFKEDGIILDELFAKADSEELVQIAGKNYTYKQLFLKMLKMHRQQNKLTNTQAVYTFQEDTFRML